MNLTRKAKLLEDFTSQDKKIQHISVTDLKCRSCSEKKKAQVICWKLPKEK